MVTTAPNTSSSWTIRRIRNGSFEVGVRRFALGRFSPVATRTRQYNNSARSNNRNRAIVEL